MLNGNKVGIFHERGTNPQKFFHSQTSRGTTMNTEHTAGS